MKKNETTDMNGNVENGDSVIFTKSMKVKETQIHLKKGAKVKNIRLTDDLWKLMERDRTRLVLKTALLRRNKRVFSNFGIGMSFSIL